MNFEQKYNEIIKNTIKELQKLIIDFYIKNKNDNNEYYFNNDNWYSYKSNLIKPLLIYKFNNEIIIERDIDKDDLTRDFEDIPINEMELYDLIEFCNYIKILNNV